MKVLLFFLTYLFFTTISYSQINWNDSLSNAYNKYDNYLLEVKSKVWSRGLSEIDSIGRRIVKDTVFNEFNDTILYYIEKKEGRTTFLSVNRGMHLSFLKINLDSIGKIDRNITRCITIDNSIKMITQNFISDFAGLGDVSKIIIPLADYSFVLFPEDQIKPEGSDINFRKDTIINNKEYLIYEGKSLTNSNDIDILHSLTFYIDKKTMLLEKLEKQMLDFTIDKMELDVYKQVYEFNYINFNFDSKNYLLDYDIDNKKYKSYMFVPEGENSYEYYIKNTKKTQTDLWLDSVLNIWYNQDSNLSNEYLNKEFANIDDGRFKLKDFDGWLFLNSWYTTCYGCFELMKTVNREIEEFEKRNLKIISVNYYDAPSKYMKEFCGKRKVDLSQVYFTKRDIMFCPTSPSIMLISPDKKIVYKNHNPSTFEVNEILSDIDKVMKEYYEKK